MPKKIFDLSGIITIDGLERTVAGLKKVDGYFKQAEKSLVKFGRQAEKAGSVLTKNITLPLALLGGVVTKFGADFEKSMSGSLAIMGDISDEMRGKMEKAALDVSKSTTFSANDAAKSYFYLASAGLDATQSLAAMPKVAKFAQAGLFDMALATDLLTDAQSALGLTIRDDVVKNMENMSRVSDVLVKANTLSNATVQQFSESLTNKAGAALKVLGKDVEEGVAVLAAFADQGVKGAEGGTQLAIVLRDLQRASIENRKAFNEAGIAVYDSSGDMRNMADILEQLEGRFSKMSDEGKRAELMTLGFNDKSIQATMALIGTSNAIRNYEEKLRSAAGTTDEIANKQLKNFWSQLTLVWHKIQAVGIELYGSLQPILINDIIPAFEKTAAKLENAVKWFGSLEDTTKKNIISFLAFTALFGPFLLIVGKSILAVKAVTGAIAALRVATMALSATMLTNPFVIVIAGAGALAGALWGAKKAYDNLIASHRRYEVMTKGQAAVKDFTAGVAELTKKINALGESLNDEKVIDKELGKDTEKLTEQARELGFVLEGTNKERIAGLLVIDQELRGVRDATGALIKYSSAKKQSVKGAKDTGGASVKRTKEELEAIEKLNKESRDRIAAATLDKGALWEKELNQAIEHAKKIGADVSLVERAFVAERVKMIEEEQDRKAEARKQEGDDRSALEADYAYKLINQTGDKIALLEHERKIAIQEAIKKGVAIEQVNKYYDNERKKAEKELKAEQVKDFDDLVNRYMSAIGEIGSGIASIFQQSSANKQVALDNQQQKEREVIENSINSEKEKRRLLHDLDLKQDKEQRALRKKAASESKKIAIFDSIIGTAAAVVNALKSVAPPLNFIYAGIVGGIGALKTALIGAQPLPLARGAIIRRRPQGVLARIGEGSEDEGVIPLKTGVREIADRLLSAMRESFTPRVPLPLLTGGGSGNGVMAENHWHIGVLVADNNGVKELERRMLPYRTAEAQRKGQA
jgi:TP901 family phage tail tape measure protein